jgi:hypothetical protein
MVGSHQKNYLFNYKFEVSIISDIILKSGRISCFTLVRHKYAGILILNHYKSFSTYLRI